MKRFAFVPSLLLAAFFPTARAVTLDQVLARTAEKDPVILRAKDALEMAAGDRIVLRAIGLPKGIIGAAGGDQGGRRAQTSSDRAFIFAYGSFFQPIFEAAIPASYRRGEAGLALAQQQFNLAMVTELHKARLAFYAALYNHALDSLGESQRQALQANVASEQARYEAGESDRGAVASATLLASEIGPKIEAARSGYREAVLHLAEAMGESLGRGAVLPQPEGEMKFQDVDLHWKNAVGPALEHRVDIKLARLLVQSAREDERIAASENYPAIAAVASGEAIPVSGIYRDSGGSPQATDNILASEVRAGVSYTWRVIDNGKVGGAVLRRRATRQTNEVQLRTLEASVPRELQRLENNLRAIGARHSSLSRAAQLAEETVTAVQQNREQGFATVLDLRNAESSLLDSRSALLTAIYEQKVALAEWDRATGRYLQFSHDTAVKLH